MSRRALRLLAATEPESDQAGQRTQPLRAEDVAIYAQAMSSTVGRARASEIVDPDVALEASATALRRVAASEGAA